jgi:TIR domain-containing protein
MPVKIFFCYAREDETLLNKLKSHLRPLQRQGLIDVWYDREISAGAEWEQEIKQNLNSAQIILLLISPSFMDSDYCYSVELKRALERHESGEARVIPIILEYVYWQIESLSKLQALPTDAKPIISASWHSQNEALYNVTEGIRAVVEKVSIHHFSATAIVEKVMQEEMLQAFILQLSNPKFFLPLSESNGLLTESQFNEWCQWNLSGYPSSGGSLQFDGLYRADSKDGTYDRYLRFYPDGAVIESSVSGPSLVENVAHWFGKNHNVGKGRYKQSGTQIAFTTQHVANIAHVGKIINNEMICLEMYSYRTYHRSLELYKFYRATGLAQ